MEVCFYRHELPGSVCLLVVVKEKVSVEVIQSNHTLRFLLKSGNLGPRNTNAFLDTQNYILDGELNLVIVP